MHLSTNANFTADVLSYTVFVGIVRDGRGLHWFGDKNARTVGDGTACGKS